MDTADEDAMPGVDQLPAMSKPMPFSARTGCLLVTTLGFVLVLLCLASVQLVARGEIRWRLGELRENRVWLVREGDAQGLAWSSMRVMSGSERERQACIESEIRFWLWSGDQTDLGAIYCECFRSVDGAWVSQGACGR